MTRKPTSTPLLLLMLVSLATTAAEFDGVLDWARTVALGMPVSGVVAAVYVEEGDLVHTGQRLAMLDQRRFEAGRKEAQARVSEHKEIFLEAQRELSRALELFDRTVLSEHELQQAHIAHSQAQARYQAAQAMLTQAELDIAYSEVKAPFDAIVLERSVEPAETILSEVESSILFRLAQTGSMVVRIRVDLEAVNTLSVGQAARVRTAGRDYSGRINKLGLEPIHGSVPLAYWAQVGFDLSQHEILRAGIPARVELQ